MTMSAHRNLRRQLGPASLAEERSSLRIYSGSHVSFTSGSSTGRFRVAERPAINNKVGAATIGHSGIICFAMAAANPAWP